MPPNLHLGGLSNFLYGKNWGEFSGFLIKNPSKLKEDLSPLATRLPGLYQKMRLSHSHQIILQLTVYENKNISNIIFHAHFQHISHT